MMQRTIYIDQEFALRFDMVYGEAAVYWFFTRLPNWAQPVIIQGELYYFAAKTMACANLPIVTTKPDTMYRIYRKLKDKGLVKLAKHGTKDLVHVVPEFARQWNNANYHDPKNSDSNPTGLVFKSEKTRIQIRNGSDSNPTYIEEYETEEMNGKKEPVSGVVENHDGGSQPSLFIDDVEAAPEKKKSCAKKRKPTAADYRKDADGLLIFLNTMAGRDYAREEMPGAENNRKGVVRLLRAGYSVNQIQDMITLKVYEWNDKPKSRVWVRPSTLFGGKAETYLDAARQAQEDPKFAAMFADAKAAESGAGGYTPDAVSQTQLQDLANW